MLDAARVGVPLIVSDHDDSLTSLLRGRPWALAFPAGDPDALTETLHTVVRQPPERPGPEAPRLLGYGVDYPERDYFALEAPVVAEVRERLVELVAAGRDAVLDHGLWLRSAREGWKKEESAGEGGGTLPGGRPSPV